ncbi:nucleotidyltransferase [Corynebacterium sp. ES2794-CONJ1]|uniref:putative nucleotidyltransferase substrate binding domain-containing protein n=1 Tax=unclassified Corynebacterium TaxID=2624378 RepID=UPI002166C704|nr:MULTISPECIES: putative nucleotidyltransferase substrate binding domain-containing protein [unclassified Corynebacterium]MCS4491613.1 nucleotidyltransferase [Corynebacterium sp. ES2715-CONJ3]MCS4531717.1 nucleotidyltransferase [Corynebacterium sp. ES2730-CONJ]MCU9519113.1 nucleotidyltransferase [Corynebacterium sp. ES2794-CONJ1]
MHDSLLELASQAPQCQNAATARGILLESQDLIRNAIEHEARPQELVIWFSRLITDVLHSEGIKDLTGGADLVLTGAVGRGDALPSSPIKWLTVGGTAVDTQPLIELIGQVGLLTERTHFGFEARSKEKWLMELKGTDGRGFAVFADAGTWLLAHVVNQENAAVELLKEAFTYRPPAVRMNSGLPDLKAHIDIRQSLLYPIIALARWAGVAAKSQEFSTPARLNSAVLAGTLEAAQADYLRTAWESGLGLQFRRFTDRVHGHETTAASLPAIQRSTYGASTRMVSDVFSSLESALPAQKEV